MTKIPPLNILILDDCAADSSLLARKIRASGLEGTFQRVRTETQYRVALVSSVHLIFADIAASRLSVRHALDILREYKLNIPFILLCKSGDEECGLDDLASHVTDIIPKDRLDLAGPAIRRALRARAEQERLASELVRAQKIAMSGRITAGRVEKIDEILATIGTDVELALSQSDLPIETQKKLDEVKTSAARASTLVSELLDPGRPRARVTAGSKTILLVDDDEALRRLTALALVRHGYKVLQAASATGALQLWAQQIEPIDLLLTNLALPGGLSGADLAAQLRDCQRPLKVILMGNCDPSVIAPGVHLHEKQFIQKPCAVAELIVAVRQSLA